MDPILEAMELMEKVDLLEGVEAPLVSAKVQGSVVKDETIVTGEVELLQVILVGNKNALSGEISGTSSERLVPFSS